MTEITPKISMSVNLLALLTMIVGGGAAYGRLQANIDEHAAAVDKLNKILDQRTGQVVDLQLTSARRDEQFVAIQRDMTYLRQSLDKIAERLERTK
jgi:hypothetical protein